MTSQSRNEFISKLKHYLVPPGEGVFTVHTASDKRESLQKKCMVPMLSFKIKFETFGSRV